MSNWVYSYFVKIKDKVKFTNVSEVLIKYLYKHLHKLKDYEFIVIFINNGYEVETGVAFVYNFVLFVI
jgi:hypothetical protein